MTTTSTNDDVYDPAAAALICAATDGAATSVPDAVHSTETVCGSKRKRDVVGAIDEEEDGSHPSAGAGEDRHDVNLNRPHECTASNNTENRTRGNGSVVDATVLPPPRKRRKTVRHQTSVTSRRNPRQRATAVACAAVASSVARNCDHQLLPGWSVDPPPLARVPSHRRRANGRYRPVASMNRFIQIEKRTNDEVPEDDIRSETAKSWLDKKDDEYSYIFSLLPPLHQNESGISSYGTQAAATSMALHQFDVSESTNPSSITHGGDSSEWSDLKLCINVPHHDVGDMPATTHANGDPGWPTRTGDFYVQGSVRTQWTIPSSIAPIDTSNRAGRSNVHRMFDVDSGGMSGCANAVPGDHSNTSFASIDIRQILDREEHILNGMNETFHALTENRLQIPTGASILNPCGGTSHAQQMNDLWIYHGDSKQVGATFPDVSSSDYKDVRTCAWGDPFTPLFEALSLFQPTRLGIRRATRVHNAAGSTSTPRNESMIPKPSETGTNSKRAKIVIEIDPKPMLARGNVVPLASSTAELFASNSSKVVAGTRRTVTKFGSYRPAFLFNRRQGHLPSGTNAELGSRHANTNVESTQMLASSVEKLEIFYGAVVSIVSRDEESLRRINPLRTLMLVVALTAQGAFEHMTTISRLVGVLKQGIAETHRIPRFVVTWIEHVRGIVGKKPLRRQTSSPINRRAIEKP